MLTIYEQIQNAIEFTEANLFELVSPAGAADAATMSLSSFQRYFPALTGYCFSEYVRKRRLTQALGVLMSTEATVLEIAVRSGYDSHEAFTRAFKREFGVAPLRFRSEGLSAARTERLDVVGGLMMGVLTKHLPEMKVAYFDGFRPEPEHEALLQLSAWMREHPEVGASCRTFGHNIDRSGSLAHEPDNDGYRVMVTVPDGATFDESTRLMTVEPGTFVVTGIEGSFDDDPTGSWITEGWRRLQVMVERQGLHVHESCRWFEESLEPTEPGRTRFDLYLEVEPERT